MKSKQLLRETRIIEQQLANLEIQGALIEAMRDETISRIIMAEQRKVVKFAVDLGIVSSKNLNEGFIADAMLGIGQAVGSLPILAQTGVGAAFGAAGVLYYGLKALKTAGFDLVMNVIFTLLSAAAIEPSGVFGEAGALGKLIKPFAELGRWAKNLGGAIKTGAAGAFNSLSLMNKGIVKAALAAEGPLMKGINFIKTTVIPRIGGIFNSIAETVSKLPGGENFAAIVKRVTDLAGYAIKELEPMIKSLIQFGKNALGTAAEKTTTLAGKMSPRMQAKAVNLAGHEAGLGGEQATFMGQSVS